MAFHRRSDVHYPSKVAVVTGASSGIGRAIALELSRRGATVIGLARRRDLLDELAAEFGGGGRVVVCDVSDAEAYRRVLGEIEAEHGHLDVLVNNAGVDLMLPVASGQGSTDGPETMPAAGDETVHTVFDVNFFAAVAGTLAVLPGMQARGWGAVVNVSSDTVRAPEPRQGAYAASKAALTAFSESVAYEVADRGVHVHVLYPGWVPTAMGLSGSEDGGSLPPKMVRRTADGVATLVADRIGGPHVDINAARLPLLAPVARTVAPLSYQKAMRRMATT